MSFSVNSFAVYFSSRQEYWYHSVTILYDPFCFLHILIAKINIILLPEMKKNVTVPPALGGVDTSKVRKNQKGGVLVTPEEIKVS